MNRSKMPMLNPIKESNTLA